MPLGRQRIELRACRRLHDAEEKFLSVGIRGSRADHAPVGDSPSLVPSWRPLDGGGTYPFTSRHPSVVVMSASTRPEPTSVEPIKWSDRDEGKIGNCSIGS